jgi:hypothetical protein
MASPAAGQGLDMGNKSLAGVGASPPFPGNLALVGNLSSWLVPGRSAENDGLGGAHPELKATGYDATIPLEIFSAKSFCSQGGLAQKWWHQTAASQ